MEIAKYLKDNIFNVVILILIGVLIMMDGIKEDTQDEYNLEFCMEWEGGITRETLVYECYNFKQQEIMCDWVMTSDHWVIIYEYGDTSKIISENQCIRFAKTKIVEPKELIQEEESIQGGLEPGGELLGE